MKILHWDEAFHPAFGYQINSLAKYEALEGHNVTIVSSDNIDKFPVFKNFQSSDVDVAKLDKEYSKKYNIKIVRWPWRISKLAKSRIIHKRGFLKFLKESDADIIMVHTNDTISSIRIALHHKYINKPLIFDNHMLDMASKNPFRSLFRFYFKVFVTPIIRSCKWIVIRTQDDDYIIKHFKIPKEQAPFISFGSDLTLFHPNEELKVKFKKEHGIPLSEPLFVYAGKLTPEKGGELLAESFLKKINDKRMNLVVVGNTSGDYGMKVNKLFENSENNIIRYGTQKFIDLAYFYQVSDFAIFPKQCSLSFYDVQACGLPTLLESNNINRDRLSHNNGFIFEPCSVDGFRNSLNESLTLFKNKKEYAKMRNNCLKFIENNYDYKSICEKYTALIKKEYERQNEQINK